MRARPPEADDAHAARGPVVAEADARRLERGDELGGRRRLREPRERSGDLAGGAPPAERDRRMRVRLDARIQPERGGGRAVEDLAERGGGIVRLAQLIDGGERARALLAQEGVDVGGLQPALPAHAAVPLVDARSGEPGRRRAEPGEQLVAPAAQPGVAAEPRQRVADRGLGQRRPGVERVRDIDRGERRGEGRVCGVAGGQHDQQIVRVRFRPAARARPRRPPRAPRPPRRRPRADARRRRATPGRRVGARRTGRARARSATHARRSRRGGCSISSAARAERRSNVAVAAANASRPGSNGSATVADARAAIASTRLHCAERSSSKPYTSSGCDPHADSWPAIRRPASATRADRSSVPRSIPSRPGRDQARDGARTRRRTDRRELALEQLRLDAGLGALVDEAPERRSEARGARRRAERGRSRAHGEPAQVQRAHGGRKRRARAAGPHQDALCEALEGRHQPAEQHTGALGELALEHHALRLVGHDQHRVVPAPRRREELPYDQPELAAPGRPYDQPERHASVLRPASAAAAMPAPAPRPARSPSRCCRGTRS